MQDLTQEKLTLSSTIFQELQSLKNKGYNSEEIQEILEYSFNFVDSRIEDLD